MDNLLTTAEVAEKRGVSVKTIHRMVETGRLTPVQKLPGRTGSYLFTPESLEEAADE